MSHTSHILDAKRYPPLAMHDDLPTKPSVMHRLVRLAVTIFGRSNQEGPVYVTPKR